MAVSLHFTGSSSLLLNSQSGERPYKYRDPRRFETIAGAAHYPQIEQPEAVADRIARFAQEN